MKKYLSSYKWGLKVLTLVMAVCIVIFIVCAILGNHVKYGGLVFFLVTLMISLVPLYRFRKFCRQLEADGKFSQAEHDFETATVICKDTIRFGQAWIFIKRKGSLLSYAEIRQVELYIDRSSSIRHWPALRYQDAHGKVRKMCKLEFSDSSIDEGVALLQAIRQKNPEVKFIIPEKEG